MEHRTLDGNKLLPTKAACQLKLVAINWTNKQRHKLIILLYLRRARECSVYANAVGMSGALGRL